ncbi:MAG TPA: phosphatidylserine decarboxylase, partial [Candidatus Saccharimonadales bacterium]|nr:phosphatidylserine decarboxylase [Candidatus Saccharimonadales bacterium]
AMIPAAWPYVLSLGGAGVLLLALQRPVLGALPILAAAFVAFFFRDPERQAPPGEEQVVSPADGKVVEIVEQSAGQEGRIAIFLSLFNVHVNRAPVSGRVSKVTYRPGSFKPAYDERASSVNERNTLELAAPAGSFGVSQIAGVVARRIRCFKSPGDDVRRGERIGYIAFGSRTELTLPREATITVSVGQTVRGGETVVARLPVPREGES